MLTICHPKKRKTIVYFLIFLTLVFSTGCFHEFYKANSSDLTSLKKMVVAGDSLNYYVVHYQGKAMQLDHMVIQDGNMEAVLVDLPVERARMVQKDQQSLKKTKTIKGLRYRPNEKFVIYSMHIYLQDEVPISFEAGPQAIPLYSVKEIHRYSKDQDATVLSHVGGFFLLMIPVSIGGAAIGGGLDIPLHMTY